MPKKIETEQYDGEFDAELHDAAWEVARASQERGPDALDRADLVVDALADSGSAAYRRGAADALAAVVTALRQRTLSHEAKTLLLSGRRAIVLNAVVAWPGRSQKTLADILHITTSQLSDLLADLRRAGLIEAAPIGAAGNFWQLSNWGRTVAKQLAAVLRERIGEHYVLGLGRPDLDITPSSRSTQEVSRLGEARVMRMAAYRPGPSVLSDTSTRELTAAVESDRSLAQ